MDFCGLCHKKVASYVLAGDVAEKSAGTVISIMESA
jgi:hypothetical protein